MWNSKLIPVNYTAHYILQLINILLMFVLYDPFFKDIIILERYSFVINWIDFYILFGKYLIHLPVLLKVKCFKIGKCCVSHTWLARIDFFLLMIIRFKREWMKLFAVISRCGGCDWGNATAVPYSHAYTFTLLHWSRKSVRFSYCIQIIVLAVGP